LHRYTKPAQRPEPFLISHVSATEPDVTSSSVAAGGSRDLVWKLARLNKGEIPNIPAWTAFNAFLTDSELPVARIRYLPFIRAPPSDLTTIYTVLQQLVGISETFGQSHILVTADMAIYSKAQQIIWNKPECLDGKVTMRIGGMHLTMAYLAALGKLYGDGGLLAMLTESSVYAEASAR
jgi:hypothetical protein